MNAEMALMQALHEDPGDETSWLILGDWLEEQGRLAQAELLRLFRQLRHLPAGLVREASEQRMSELLATGVVPCVPGLVNSLGMRFHLIPPGSFHCAAPAGHRGPVELEKNSGPEVELPSPFYLGIHPVTQAQFQTIFGNNPSHFSKTGEGRSLVYGLDTGSFPVEMVTWEEAVLFCERLSEREDERAAGRVYRLPTEAEWEYACRAAGTSTTAFAVGNALSSSQANFDGNHPFGGAERGPYLQRPTPVGSYPCNALGLYDLHGNVYEWCEDPYDPEVPVRQVPRGAGRVAPSSGRVVRGGSWFSPGSSCQSSYRGSNAPSDRSYIIGFRVVCSLSG